MSVPSSRVMARAAKFGDDPKVRAVLHKSSLKHLDHRKLYGHLMLLTKSGLQGVI